MNWYFSMSCYSRSQGDSADALLRIMATASRRIIDVCFVYQSSPALMCGRVCVHAHVNAAGSQLTNIFLSFNLL